eukprot:gene17747-23346_t
MKEKKQSLYYDNIRRWGIDISAGLISSVISKTIVAPVERVKLLMQTSSHYGKLGLIKCSKEIYYSQGFYSFWKGNVANILRYFPNSTLNFAFKDRFKNLLFGYKSNDEINFWVMFWGSLLSGGLAGGVCLIGSHPLDIVRTRFAADMTASTYHIVPLFRSKTLAGISSLYRGFGLALTGMVLFKGLYMGGYDILLETILHKRHKSSYLSIKKFIAAWTLTLVVGTIIYPFDTIRRRLMMQKTIRNEGVKALFNGISANMIRSIGGALVLFSYNEIKSALL